MHPFLCPVTISGPLGQYTVDAVVDESAAYTSAPAPALIEMGFERVRVVRLKAEDGGVHFRQLHRALTTVLGQEDVITPVLFGEFGETAVVGAATLMLRVDHTNQRIAPAEGQLSSLVLTGGEADA